MTDIKKYKDSFLAFLRSEGWAELQREKSKELTNLHKQLADHANDRDKDMLLKGEIAGIEKIDTLFDRIEKSIKRGSQ